MSNKTEANDFRKKAHALIPGGAHTYSKGDDQLPINAPSGFSRGKGARVWDLDGNEYVDWGMGINSVLIGHAEDEIDDAAIEALRQGQNLSRPTILEVEMAERIVALYPGMDMAKFAKNGSDANNAAIRLARAITGRQLIAFDGAAPFLSTDDWFIGTTVLSQGVPSNIQDLTVTFQYNDTSSVEKVFSENPRKIACVILEPCREIQPEPGFLETVRRLCDENETLLIFDENVTGFRYSLSGAGDLFDVIPDFTTLGKGIANGFSLSALLGRREYMERGGIDHSEPRAFILSTTNGAERSALAAGIATIDFYQTHDVIEHLYHIGQSLMEGLRTIASEFDVDEFVGATSDFACRPTLFTLDSDGNPSLEYRTLFLQEMIRHYVFIPWVCPSFRNGQLEMEQTMEAFRATCAVYSQAVERRTVEGLLHGRAVKPVFRSHN